MLKIERITSPYPVRHEKTGEELFRENRDFIFTIDAPFMWWLDVDGLRYGYALNRFSPSEIKDLTLSTNVVGMLSLPYQDLVEICEDYLQGAYNYTNKDFQFPIEREWKDFCETIMDIKGIRDLTEDE